MGSIQLSSIENYAKDLIAPPKKLIEISKNSLISVGMFIRAALFIVSLNSRPLCQHNLSPIFAS